MGIGLAVTAPANGLTFIFGGHWLIGKRQDMPLLVLYPG